MKQHSAPNSALAGTVIHTVKHMLVSWVEGRVTPRTGRKDNIPTRTQTSEIGTFEHPQLSYRSTNLLIFPYYFAYRSYIKELYARNVCK